MQRSEARILTTHAGSLPRPAALRALHVRASRGEPVDAAEMARAVQQATRRVVAAQVEAGIDAGSDGEQARESFFTYVQHRMSGFGGESPRLMGRDLTHFPSYGELRRRMTSDHRVDLARAPQALAELQYVNRAPLQDECAGYRESLEGHPGFRESFKTAASPGIIACAMHNRHDANQEAYLSALAGALRVEYESIVAQGFILQIDAPDLAMERHMSFQLRPLDEFQAFVGLTIRLINGALVNVPKERVRLHVCWGSYGGPHTFDVPLADILPLLYRANVGALLLPFANPRHAHEYRCLRGKPAAVFDRFGRRGPLDADGSPPHA